MQRSGAVGGDQQVQRCAAGCVLGDRAVLRIVFDAMIRVVATVHLPAWQSGWVFRDEVREAARTSSCSTTAHRTRKWSFLWKGSRHERATSARATCGGDCVSCRSTSASSGPLSSMAGYWLAGGCHRSGGPLAALIAMIRCNNAAGSQFMHSQGFGAARRCFGWGSLSDHRVQIPLSQA